MMKTTKISRAGIGIILLLLFALPAFGNDDIRFLFLGDLHYLSPDGRNAEIVEDLARDIKEKGYKID
ncbi:MAG: hypothetical protein WC552_10025, partial [Candidatus Omnitrophota bacterium]